MPKKMKHELFDKLSFENLLLANERARKNKTNKEEVVLFEKNLECNLTNLERAIRNGMYRIGKYTCFDIKEPKVRRIMKLPYIDRIVHQWYVGEYIEPYFLPRLITDTFACIKGRGTHAAVDKIERYMRIAKRKFGSYWIVKCDIKKFFENIDRDILFEIVANSMSKDSMIEFTGMLIYDNMDGVKGIPIGNYTSQFFANIYLNELDKYVKRDLGVKWYVRYMDDFVILCGSRHECRSLKYKIEMFIKEKLKLELNYKSKYYPGDMGLDFCGFRIFEPYRLIRKGCKTRIKKRVRKFNKDWEAGNINFPSCMQSLNSWNAHVSHANSYRFSSKILSQCNFIYKENEESGKVSFE